MALKGYSSIAKVEAMAGIEFDSAQVIACYSALLDAEAHIDAQTGGGWAGSAVTETHRNLSGPSLWLRTAPIAGVTSVNVRSAWGDTTDEALVAGTSYSVTDLASGELYLPYWTSYDSVTVVYTPTAAVPALIGRAATELALWFMQSQLQGGTIGVKQFNLGGEMAVTFEEIGRTGVPVSIERKIKSAAARWVLA